MTKGICSITKTKCDRPFPPMDVDVYPCDDCDTFKTFEIFDKYKKKCDNCIGDMQGLCLIIADEMQKAIGGEVVAGFLCMNGGRRSHWWIEKDGIVYDFMGDAYVNEMNFHRQEEHRNKEIFESVLPQYEKYRIW